jgi:GNAT superfamily N-acetyltransferase
VSRDHPIEIRPPRMQDLTTIKVWLQDPELSKHLQVEKGKELDEQLQFFLNPRAPSFTLVATQKNKPIGLLVLFASDYQTITHWAHVSLIVAPGKRRLGVARSLLKEVDTWAAKRGCERLILELYENPYAQAFEKLGFKPYATQEGYLKIGDQYLSRTLYKREVTC